MFVFVHMPNICDCRCMPTEFGPLESGDTDPLSFVLIFCIMMFAADSLVEACSKRLYYKPLTTPTHTQADPHT